MVIQKCWRLWIKIRTLIIMRQYQRKSKLVKVGDWLVVYVVHSCDMSHVESIECISFFYDVYMTKAEGMTQYVG